MEKVNQKTMGFPHRPPKEGGPGSFQTRFAKVLEAKGWGIVYPDDDIVPDVILVVGGTAKLKWLKYCKKRGTKIIHRLDGLNWRHKGDNLLFKNPILWLGATIRNRLLIRIRNKFADKVIYQSEFIREWWHRDVGTARAEEHIIYNAVNLDEFSLKEGEIKKVVSVEGNIQDDGATLDLIEKVNGFLMTQSEIESYDLYGNASSKLQNCIANLEKVNLIGSIPREKMPSVFSNGSIMLVLEINPPCPNSVIESLASGVPVIGYNTGSFKELVKEGAGESGEYDGNPWTLAVPQARGVIDAMKKVFDNYEAYRKTARKVALDNFDVNQMTNKYLEVIESVL